MCNHQDTVIINGVQTCHACGAWRTVDNLSSRPKSEWRFDEVGEAAALDYNDDEPVGENLYQDDVDDLWR
jgi:hypothetical protein